MDSSSQDPYQPVFTPSPPSMDFGLHELANVASLAPLNSTFGSGQLPGLNDSNLLPSLSSTPGSPQVPIKNSLINPDEDKENEKEGDKEKAVEIEEAQVFNENGDIMVLEKRKLSRHQESVQKSKDPKELRGPRCMSFCENSNARCKSRSNHIKGLCKKMKDLKTTTHDESLMFVYKDFGTSTCTIKKFATSVKLLDGHMNKAQELPAKKNFPEDSFLKEFSPSKKRKKQRYACEICGIVYNSGRDNEYGNPWIGCDQEGCDVWQHLGCMGLQMSRSIKALTWKCALHRPKPPKASSIVKKGKKC